ncbi:MAG: DUF3164 family protein [Burkholderiaceae bacterium]|nr:DUF3164 family protein [Burkholderiaceae bacterium]
MNTETTSAPAADDAVIVPAGYRMDAQGRIVPLKMIKAIDLQRDSVVTQLCVQAEAESARLFGFKSVAMQSVSDFVSASLANYGIKHGGKKGNITLVSFCGKYKIIRQMQETISFDERLQAAKALIDECIQTWSKGSNVNIKTLVNDAFQVNAEGKISTGRVLRLRSLDIADEKWAKAMHAIADSMRADNTKSYMRFYKRNDETGEYFPISLDVAVV